MSFLKAEWRKLAFANYEVDPEILTKYLPYGTELDLWNNRCYASLVGFMFMNVRLLGIRVPYHINFEEVNLRFYVRRRERGSWKRGVVFVKEIVPKRALTFVANTVYGENYATHKMSHRWQLTPSELTVEYTWLMESDWQSFRITTGTELSTILPGSEDEFITEHYWGYARRTDTSTNEYEVTHPKWRKYDVLNFEIKVDFGRLYGAAFAFLSQAEPSSVMLADGSEITVESRRKLNAGMQVI